MNKLLHKGVPPSAKRGRRMRTLVFFFEKNRFSANFGKDSARRSLDPAPFQGLFRKAFLTQI